MKRFARTFTSLVAISCLAPNIVFGATGDIYDLNTNIKYSVGSSQDKSILKQNLKSGFADENNLYVEQTDGTMLSYKDMQRAKREAILNVMSSHGVDISDETALTEALKLHASEVAQEQQSALLALTKKDVPVSSTTPTNDDTALAEVKYDIKDDSGTAKFHIKSMKCINQSSYDKPVDVTVIQNGSIVFQQSDVAVNQEISFPYSTDSIIQIRKSPGDETFVTLTLKNRTGDWRVSREKSKLDLGIAGNSVDGYVVAWDISLIEMNSRGDERSYAEDVTLNILDSKTNSVLHTIPTSSNADSVIVSTMDTYEPIIQVVNTTTGKVLLENATFVSNYELSGKVDLLVDITQPTYRRDMEISLIDVDYPQGEAFVEVRQGDSLVSESPLNTGDTLRDTYTQGVYTINVYTSESRDVKLASSTVNFEWAPLDEFSIPINSVSTSDLPWEDTNQINIRFRPTWNSLPQTNEMFNVRVINTKTDTEVFNSELHYDEMITLPTELNSLYKIQQLQNGKVIYEQEYQSPTYVHVNPSPYTDYDTDTGKLTIKLRDKDGSNSEDYRQSLREVKLLIGTSVSDITTTIIVPISDLTGDKSDIMIPKLPDAGTSICTQLITDSYGNTTRIITGMEKYSSSLSGNLELPELPPELPPEAFDPPTIPETSDDLEFEESGVSQLDTFVNANVDLVNNPDLATDSKGIEYSIETPVLPNINKSEESDDGDELPDDIEPEDFEDIDLPVLEF